MRANIPRVSKKQMDAIRKEVAKELENQERGNVRRLFKLFCAALHTEYGFGKKRCMRAITTVSRLADEHRHDEVYWTHVDMLMKQIGLDFSQENYDEVEK